MLSKSEAAAELLRRRHSRKALAKYIKYSNPRYVESYFSNAVCDALDKFVQDMIAGKRPILLLQAPPQHGKSEIISRKFPAYLLSKFPDWFIGAFSYSDDLTGIMSLDVRRNLASKLHRVLFPVSDEKRKFVLNRDGEFTSPYGDGCYIGRGVGQGATGRPLTIGIIDDPIKDAKEALSPTTKKGIYNWYQTVFCTRMAENSGQIIMATSWAQDDLSGEIQKLYAGDERLTVLRFPAINLPGETGYNPALPEGALVPELHSLTQLREFKSKMSDYWWSALYQQNPKPLGGNVFKESGIRYYLPKDLPDKFDKCCISIDATFKDTDGTDFVVGQVWGKKGANSYLLYQVRARMSFTKTVAMVVDTHEKFPKARTILIEDKANGPAVIDTLKSEVPGILAVEPDGSKLARAHAVTSYWEAGNVWLPDPAIAPWVKDFVDEITAFDAAPNDDQVDSMTQALRWLYPLFNTIKISQEAINKAMGKRPFR